jgi:hypothetical protein
LNRTARWTQTLVPRRSPSLAADPIMQLPQLE